jgi:hypothetical protein
MFVSKQFHAARQGVCSGLSQSLHIPARRKRNSKSALRPVSMSLPVFVTTISLRLCVRTDWPWCSSAPNATRYSSGSHHGEPVHPVPAAHIHNLTSYADTRTKNRIWSKHAKYIFLKALCYKPEGSGFDSQYSSGRTRPWGLLSMLELSLPLPVLLLLRVGGLSRVNIRAID